MSVGSNIRKLRTEKNYSQQYVDDILNVDRR